MVSEAGAYFFSRRIRTSLSREDKRFIVPYVLRLIAISPKPGWFEGAVKVRQYEPMKAVGINECYDVMVGGD